MLAALLASVVLDSLIAACSYIFVFYYCKVRPLKSVICSSNSVPLVRLFFSVVQLNVSTFSQFHISQFLHFFRTDPIPQNLRISRYRSNPIPAHFFLFILFFMYFKYIISILLCVDPIVTLLCVKRNLLQCLSTGRSKVLGMLLKSGLRDHSESVADCLQPKKRHQQKTLST